MGEEPPQAQDQVGSREQVNSCSLKPRRQKRYLKEGKEQLREMTGDLSVAQGQCNQADVKFPKPVQAGGNSTKQTYTALNSVMTRCKASRVYKRKKPLGTAAAAWAHKDSDGDSSKAEAEDSEAVDLRNLATSSSYTVWWKMPQGSVGQGKAVPGSKCSKAGRQCPGEEVAGSSLSSGSSTLL